jgi:hypothetical protein
LVALSKNHIDGLVSAGRDGDLWQLWYTSIPAPDEMGREIERRLGLQAAGSMLPFTVTERPSGHVVGMTTYMNIGRQVPPVEGLHRIAVAEASLDRCAQPTP